MLYKRLKIKIQMWYFYIVIIKKALKTVKVKLIGWLYLLYKNTTFEF